MAKIASRGVVILVAQAESLSKKGIVIAKTGTGRGLLAMLRERKVVLDISSGFRRADANVHRSGRFPGWCRASAGVTSSSAPQEGRAVSQVVSLLW